MKIKIENITKSYGSLKALSSFSAELMPGIYALLGPNGSGKSTLMNIIAGNLKADSGNITYTDDNGNAEDNVNMGVRFSEKLGFMPQNSGMYKEFTVYDFMLYMAALKGLDKNESKKQISDILETVELTDIVNKKIRALSGGMKQRLCLAQAILGNPEILILDEPTAGLDPMQRIVIRNYISKIAFDKIVVIATHVVSDIEFIARDIILLKKGIIVDNASPVELIKKIEGRVWNIGTEEAKVLALQNKFRVTGISKNETEVNLHILSDEKPTDDAVLVKPSLEDYYLYVFDEKVNN